MTQIIVLSGVSGVARWSDERKLASWRQPLRLSRRLPLSRTMPTSLRRLIYRWRRTLCSKLTQPTGFAAVAVVQIRPASIMERRS
jgi:transposase